MHVHETAVRLQHTDAAGIMFFLRIYELAHTAYEELLESIAHPIPRDITSADYVIPIVHSEAAHRTSLRLGDRVRVEARLTKLKGRSFTIRYEVKLLDGTLAASAQTVHVVVNPETRRAMTMPDSLKNGLATHLEVAEA